MEKVYFKEVKSKINLDTIDKTLVQEERLKFVSKNNTRFINLTDDGIMELYESNNKQPVSTTPFSRINVIAECKKLLDEGYELCEAELELPDINDDQVYKVEIISKNLNNDDFVSVGSFISKSAAIEEYNYYSNKDFVENCRITVDTPYTEGVIINKEELEEAEVKSSNGETIDTEKEKENIEQAKQAVDEIAKAKEELEDKVDELFENAEILKTEFPSSKYTKMKLAAYNFDNICKTLNDFGKLFTESQLEWLKENNLELRDIYAGIKELVTMSFFNKFEQVVSIDEYIKRLTELLG